MDIKNSPAKYEETAGAKGILEKVQASVALLLTNKVDYEFRTTITGNLHTEEDMRAIGAWIAGAKRYFLQPFKDSGDLVCGSADPSRFVCSPARTEALLAAVKPFVPDAKVRG